MYKYSKIAVDQFFKNITFTFLLVHFTQNSEALAFADQKYKENTDQSYPKKMAQETSSLGLEAKEYLQLAASTSNDISDEVQSKEDLQASTFLKYVLQTPSEQVETV